MTINEEPEEFFKRPKKIIKVFLKIIKGFRGEKKGKKEEEEEEKKGNDRENFPFSAF